MDNVLFYRTVPVCAGIGRGQAARVCERFATGASHVTVVVASLSALVVPESEDC